ncbi:MAG: DUF373 family protein [Candidatus Thermoplasmatota archaeon]|nr:DUF373 family protein [Candidatus Thermoplasmatota archaeon]
MKKLVLCVDRDNDLGEKGGVASPIIGRDEVLKATLALGLADPEDSDTNSLLAGIKTYDELKAKGEDVEVASICGAIELGLKADEVLTKQLENVLAATGAEGVILVSDGAEDENFYPIISSRAKVISLNRVFVKQAPNVERTIHVFLKTMKEEKLQRKIYVPLALALVVYGICALSGYPEMGIGAITVTLGAYFFIKAYNLEASVASFYNDIQSGMATGRISLPFSMVAAVLVVGGGIFGWGAWQSSGEIKPLESMVIFVHSSIWWFVIAAFVYGLGRVLDTYVKERVFIWTFFSYIFSIVAMGMIVSGSLYLIQLMTTYIPGVPLDVELLRLTFADIVLGVTIAIIGGYVHHYIREHEASKKSEKEKSPAAANK